MTQPNTSASSPQPGPAQARTAQHTFPDSSLTLVEFSDAGLGVLLASRTDRDAPNRRIVLTKVAYVRLEPKNWGFMAYPEVWVQQDNDGIYTALEPKIGKLFRYPSRRRYEVAFVGKEIFDCAIQCLKDRKIASLYDLIGITFGARPGFSIEAGCLLAPDDYAAEPGAHRDDEWIPFPAAAK